MTASSPRTPTVNDSGEIRDTQRARVYRAEKIAEHLIYGEWSPTIFSEDECMDFINKVLTHPGVVSRWGQRTVNVKFLPKRTGWGEYLPEENTIVLSLTTRNAGTILHELSHMLQPNDEAHHGPGFVAIYRYLFTLFLGEEPGQILNAAFESFKVSSDDSRIPPLRPGYKYNRGDTIPGLTTEQARQAANALRSAASAGMFGEVGSAQRREAYNIARKLRGMNPPGATRLSQTHRIPETVTISVADLLNMDYRDDVAELVISAVREKMKPSELVKPEPISEQEKQRRKAYDAVRKATLDNPLPYEASPLNPKNRELVRRTKARKKKTR